MSQHAATLGQSWGRSVRLVNNSKANGAFTAKGDFIGKDGLQHRQKRRKRPSWGQARGELVVGTP